MTNKVKEIQVWKFTCPKCGAHKLGQVVQTFLIYPVINIPKNGDLDYDLSDIDTSDDGEVIAHQCNNRFCDFELTDEFSNPICDVDEVADWVRDNCPQD